MVFFLHEQPCSRKSKKFAEFKKIPKHIFLVREITDRSGYTYNFSISTAAKSERWLDFKHLKFLELLTLLITFFELNFAI